MRVYRRKARGRLSPTWHVEYSDAAGTQRRVAAFPDKRASDTLGQRILELVSCRPTGTALSPDLARALDRLPERILRHLANADLLAPEAAAGAQPLAEHLHAWSEHLRQKGDTPQHATQRVGRARRLLESAGAQFWGDISPERVEAALADMRDTDHVAVSTCNAYRAAAKQFCRWLARTGRAHRNPLAFLSSQNAEPHRRVLRRALTADECRRLLAAAPPERALLYRVALETGLRRGELRTLKVRHLDLESSPATLTVEAGYAKAGRRDTQPLLPATADLLREHCRNRLPEAPVFTLSNWNRAAKTLRRDLEEAGIPYRDASGRVADFHALRHTFITALARGGVHPKTAQALARHSTLEQTMRVYTHVALDTKSEALAHLPDLDGPAAQAAESGQ